MTRPSEASDAPPARAFQDGATDDGKLKPSVDFGDLFFFHALVVYLNGETIIGLGTISPLNAGSSTKPFFELSLLKNKDQSTAISNH